MIPLILAVVFLVLLALLRALPAAVLLIGVTVLSALAALGLGSLVSEHIFGFPALDTTVPLFGFPPARASCWPRCSVCWACCR
ncbi:Mmpl [Mycobacteroides abscessus subsp. abscessus]|nr:Mmpl [Mycobacteroides abscessus subsp. abscessus]